MELIQEENEDLGIKEITTFQVHTRGFEIFQASQNSTENYLKESSTQSSEKSQKSENFLNSNSQEQFATSISFYFDQKRRQIFRKYSSKSPTPKYTKIRKGKVNKEINSKIFHCNQSQSQEQLTNQLHIQLMKIVKQEKSKYLNQVSKQQHSNPTILNEKINQNFYLARKSNQTFRCQLKRDKSPCDLQKKHDYKKGTNLIKRTQKMDINQEIRKQILIRNMIVKIGLAFVLMFSGFCFVKFLGLFDK